MISRVNSFTLSVLISCATLAALPVSADHGPPTLPLVLEENRGQFVDPIDFVVRASGYTGLLSGGDLHLQLEPSGAEERPSSLVFEIDGAADSLARGASPLPGVVLYGESCALYAAGHAAAGTPPHEFPTTLSSHQPVNQGGTDAFVIKWRYCP